MPSHRDHTVTVHASCVARAGRAVLIRGASGSGKSALALQLMALGAGLVADDRTILHRQEDAIMVRCPDAIRGRIEARGVGILAAEPCFAAYLHLVVDLDAAETQRLPTPHETELLGLNLPLLRHVEAAHFPAAIWHYLQGGRCA